MIINRKRNEPDKYDKDKGRSIKSKYIDPWASTSTSPSPSRSTSRSSSCSRDGISVMFIDYLLFVYCLYIVLVLIGFY